MNKQMLKIMPGEDEAEIAKDIERELHELDLPKKDSPDLPVANRDLVSLSSKSFANHIAQLDERIADVNRTIVEKGKDRDEAIARAEGHYKEFVHQAEKHLYQLKILRGAVELAIVALGQGD